MNTKRILLQALIGAVFFWVFKLVLGNVYTLEAFMKEGTYALLFGIFYAVFLWVRDWIRSRKNQDQP